MILVVSATVIAGMYYTGQELVQERIHVDKLLALGLEGVWGILLFFILLPVANLIKLNGKKLDDSSAWLY